MHTTHVPVAAYHENDFASHMHHKAVSRNLADARLKTHLSIGATPPRLTCPYTDKLSVIEDVKRATISTATKTGADIDISPRPVKETR